MPLRPPVPHLLLLVLALVATACSPTTSTAIAAEGLERQPDGWRGIPLERARAMPDVTLLDTDGEPFDLAAETAGSPTLLFFGYASCPDICPIHLRTLSDAMSKAGVNTEQVRVVFVSVDPDRDTPERIAQYLVDLRASSFVGLHGDLDLVEEALDALDLPGPVVEGPDPRGEGDLIGHPAQVIGFDADGEAQRVWPFGARRSDWVADLPRIVEEWSHDGAGAGA
jgi:protein SCO1